MLMRVLVDSISGFEPDLDIYKPCTEIDSWKDCYNTVIRDPTAGSRNRFLSVHYMSFPLPETEVKG
jgi:hypothetical protein